MIKIISGFNIDISKSSGPWVYISGGTALNTNTNEAVSTNEKSFKKIPNTSNFVYYDTNNDTFIQQALEISPPLLDTTHSTYLPIVFVRVSDTNTIIEYTPLSYSPGGLNPSTPITQNDISDYKILEFITEKNLPVQGTKIITTKKIYRVVDLYIYDKGDIILSSISISNNEITLPEDVSPAICEVTYGYIL